MISLTSPVTLFLSSKGDCFNHSSICDAGNFRDVNFLSDNIHPYLKKASDCKTREAVLNFLKGLNGNENCELYHEHNPKYPSHSLVIAFGMSKGSAHECPLNEMIGFVERRIKEKNSPHAVFDKIGKILGRSFHYLSIGTALPILGIIPGAVRAVIGLSQIIVGLALSLLFVLPSYVLQSENSKIIVERSIKHMGYGLLNILIGALQGTPGLGTWIYFKL